MWGCEGLNVFNSFRGFVFVGLFCSVLGWVLWVTYGLSVGNRETWLSSTRASWAWVPSFFLNSRCQRQVPRWNKKMGYSSSPSSSTTKSGTFLYISQTVFRAQIFQKLMLMGHFAPKSAYWENNSSTQTTQAQPEIKPSSHILPCCFHQHPKQPNPIK